MVGQQPKQAQQVAALLLVAVVPAARGVHLSTTTTTLLPLLPLLTMVVMVVMMVVVTMVHTRARPLLINLSRSFL